MRNIQVQRNVWPGLILLSVLILPAAEAFGADETALSRIAFGSCARQDQPQPIWDGVVAARPQLFIFLGDNIYADTEDMAVLRAKYELLANQPGFKKLKQTCPLVATWDDHDYGLNDAGGEYSKKDESQQVFLDFFGAPQNDPRRKRPGVYQAQFYGPPGRRVQVIMLDERYFRSPHKAGYQAGEPGEGLRGPYGPNLDPGATVLGEAQWKWLAEQLREPADLRLLASSVQVISHEHGFEAWANFPAERERLLRLIRDTRAGRVVILSGDRHQADISRLPADDALGVGYPLFDVTSSSLNQKGGSLTKAKIQFGNEINSYRLGLTYFNENFGLIDIDWDQPDPLIRLQVRDVQGDVVLQQRVRLKTLDAKATEQ
jgi:alkaline phosphatase D